MMVPPGEGQDKLVNEAEVQVRNEDIRKALNSNIHKKLDERVPVPERIQYKYELTWTQLNGLPDDNSNITKRWL
jgi:hypothetical protein